MVHLATSPDRDVSATPARLPSPPSPPTPAPPAPAPPATPAPTTVAPEEPTAGSPGAARSVWQPQYTLLFSNLLAQPPPHYYLHVLLPGGAESLGEPGYELEPGTKASLVGTLTRIVFARRNEDATLTLVVQGLCRGAVLRPTQYLPYSRGDVQVRVPGVP